MATEPSAPAVTLRPGDHVCGFYYGPLERDAVLLPFLRDGVRAGDKCVAVVDSERPADLLGRIGAGPDAVASGQVEVYGAGDTYLRTGSFDADRMISFWEERARVAADDPRYGFARVVGEMSWMARAAPPRDVVVRYETWADGFASRHPQAVLCLYDLQRLGSGILFDLLRTHPRLLLGGLVLENPHHLSDDEFVAGRG